MPRQPTRFHICQRSAQRNEHLEVQHSVLALLLRVVRIGAVLRRACSGSEEDASPALDAAAASSSSEALTCSMQEIW